MLVGLSTEIEQQTHVAVRARLISSATAMVSLTSKATTAQGAASRTVIQNHSVSLFQQPLEQRTCPTINMIENIAGFKDKAPHLHHVLNKHPSKLGT